MSIGVDGNYRFTFNLNGKGDFLTEAALQKYTIIEDAGGALPTFELEFETMDQSIIPKLNEGARFDVITEDARGVGVKSSLKITKPEIQRRGRRDYVVRLVGMLNCNEYDKQRVRISEKTSAIAQLKEVVGSYLKTEFDVTSSQDVQHWVQHGISDRKFVWDLMSHANLPNSFPLMGITSEGVFRLRDARKMTSRPATSKFGYEGDCYHIDPNIKIVTNTGVQNMLSGYGLSQLEYELGKSPSVVPPKITEPIKNLFTNSSSMTRAKDTDPRIIPPAFWHPDNVNPQYWEAFRRNLASLMAYSTTMVQLTVRNQVIKTRILDLAQFRDDDGGVESIESYSGLYIVTKVARTLQNRSISNTVQMIREGLNQQQGELR